METVPVDAPSPLIEWLQRCWMLPPERLPTVNRLLAAIAEGSTCWRLAKEESVPSHWGKAAAWADKVSEECATPLLLIKTAPPSHGKRHSSTVFLQSWKHYQEESLIARKFSQLAAVEPFHQERLLEMIPGLFPETSAELQREAVRRALTRSLALITGGPGTGKTYTLARILALLVRQGRSPGPGHSVRICLAAPTGKAA